MQGLAFSLLGKLFDFLDYDLGIHFININLPVRFVNARWPPQSIEATGIVFNPVIQGILYRDIISIHHKYSQKR
jgi:hypothetical protein